MLDKIKLNNLYKIYNFEIDNSEPQIGVFIYKRSRYHGVDIVPLNEHKSTLERAEQIKKGYSDSGFATELKLVIEFKEVEEELYRSFFTYDATKLRLKAKYRKFVENQSSKLPGNSRYEYISSPFEILNKNTESTNLIREIDILIEKKDPQLIIIEAAAGFGKTCSAYELLNHLVSSKNSRNPLFTELSRNRGAKIFRYVLLDEIDLEYPSLNSELVKHEISTGRLPLIIDGFDELLTNVNVPLENEDRVFEEVESMLDTIGTLLTSRTKIILTTRRTTIFTGTNFNNWLIKWNSKFETTIFSIRDPKIKDWLGNEKYGLIKERNFPIQYLANPVLLSFLRNVDYKDFGSLLEDQEGIVQNYFNFLLEREIERQNLNISPIEQYKIFKNVAKTLLELDCSSEEKEFFKQIIVSENSLIINETRKLYSAVNRPSVEELANTLSNHALLDRRGRDESYIGFINDFVFGTFIGELLIETPPSEITKYSLYMIELGVTAYMVSTREKKIQLWDKILEANEKIDIITLFKFDLTLREQLMRHYINGVFENMLIFSIQFKEHNITSSIFVNCTFRNCYFECSAFQDVSFVNCKFLSCEVKDGFFLDQCDNISIIKCSQNSCSVLARNQIVRETKDKFTQFEKDLLSKIFQLQNDSHSKSLIHLMSEYDKQDKRPVALKLEEFEHQGYLRIIGSNILLEINQIPWLKTQISL